MNKDFVTITATVQHIPTNQYAKEYWSCKVVGYNRGQKTTPYIRRYDDLKPIPENDIAIYIERFKKEVRVF